MCREPTHCSVMPGLDQHPFADRLEAAALAMVGVVFRPQGRGREGCDCLGLALHVAAAAGISIDLAPQPLRGTRPEDARMLLLRLGLRQVSIRNAGAGDILVQAPATLLLHLAVRVNDGLVEAHAGLRRVVVRPFAGDETWDSAWRLPVGDF